MEGLVGGYMEGVVGCSNLLSVSSPARLSVMPVSMDARTLI